MWLGECLGPPPHPLHSKVWPHVSATDGEEGLWRKAVIQYPVWYGDYGGVARIRFYVASMKGGTLALVFMGGEDHEVQRILHSVSMQNK